MQWASLSPLRRRVAHAGVEREGGHAATRWAVLLGSSPEPPLHLGEKKKGSKKKVIFEIYIAEGRSGFNKVNQTVPNFKGKEHFQQTLATCWMLGSDLVFCGYSIKKCFHGDLLQIILPSGNASTNFSSIPHMVCAFVCVCRCTSPWFIFICLNSVGRNWIQIVWLL